MAVPIWDMSANSCLFRINTFFGELIMSLYKSYLEEIEKRKEMGLSPKPIDSEALTTELIMQIKDHSHEHREDSLKYFVYNVLPGTTGAAGVKAQFLKELVSGRVVIEEISPDFA